MAHRIGYLVGSLSHDSINRVLATALVRVAPPSLELTEISIRDLPLYNRDDELTPAAAVTTFKEAIEGSDGLLLVSPEYNRSIPGPLKNAIDWGSRPWGHNSFARLPTGIIGASTGAIGTAVMQSSMRSVLSFLNAPQLNAPEAYITFTPEVFGADGSISDAGTEEFLTHYMSEYAAFVERVLSVTAPGHVGDRD
ncbi:NADPH-dependent FMN reductase [Streptomyces sp. AC495_CC817]|uniref:NADPH-dependent FMN reductase n=1 Tax=Streptomyces sp. AC495_CC817 TaxID=2823900 RepID=UPI001C26C924|nr:NADPH-dependent FMN reductase [Streptomyces sp. AC495_CC817]